MEAPNSRNDKIAFDYAWNYFSLHSGQRMQSVNFFLVAAAFIAGSYVSAMVGGRSGLAVGLSLLGAFSSLIFYRIERRVRGLIKAAEAAMRPIENALSDQTSNPDIRILEKVEENSDPSAWHYSVVFRRLYAMVGITFVWAAIYATHAKLATMSQATSIQPNSLPTMMRLGSGLALLIFGYGSITLALKYRRAKSDWLDVAGPLTSLVVGVLAGLGGVLVLLRLGFLG